MTNESSDLPRRAVKLTVVLPEEVAMALRTLAERNKVTMTEMLRRCIATEHWLTDLIDQGTKVFLENDGKLREVIWR